MPTDQGVQQIKNMSKTELIINSEKYGRFVVLFDEGDYELISKYTWGVRRDRGSFYCQAWIREGGKLKNITMHRLMLMPPKGLMVDHIDGNGFNNKRNNIRICTKTQNNQNKRISKKNKSGFKGVVLSRNGKKYQSFINVNRRQICGGSFENVIDAAISYNELATKHFGEFASLNEIPNTQKKPA